MPTEQKAFVVKSTQEAVEGLAALNEHLQDGWQVVNVESLGAAAAESSGAAALHFAALVIAERSGENGMSAAAVSAAEQVEEVVEEIVEGDGAHRDIEEPDAGSV